jgi:hypothetical protein
MLGSPVFAQTPGTGAISGIVYDPATKAVPNAEVSAVNEATGVSRSVTTSSEGIFRVPLLPPGTYTLTVSAGGFATSTSRSIQVTVSQTSSVNVTLAIAGTNQSVQVNETSEIADPESSTLGGLVDQTAIQGLPLSNRNYTQILGLSPGVVVDLPNATNLGSGTQNVASDGATPTANNIQFNGIDANNLSENSAAPAETDAGTAIPAPDTIQEFRVQTANFDAAYGRGTGANVDLVSKSGTNRFHGSAWEFSGIAVIQSGIPLSVFDDNAGSVYGLIGGEVRAQRASGDPETHGSMFPRVINGYLNPGAFTRAPEAPNGTSLADQDFGDSGVGFIRGPGQHNLDMAVERVFPVREASSFRIRAEFFNLTNTPQFGNPNTTLGYTDPTLLNPSASPTFGKITGTVSNPRIIQFAAKYVF